MSHVTHHMNMTQLHDFYRRQLLDNVIPFWMKHAIDRRHGGINTCLRDDGALLSTDKYMLSQFRAVWTFSALYNRIAQRDEWLDVARSVYDFALKHGRDDLGQCVFCVDEMGRVKEGPTAIYVDAFAIYGFVEYARAIADRRPIDEALAIYENLQRRLASPAPLPVAPLKIPDAAKAHMTSMIFSLVFFELGRLLNDTRILAEARRHALEVMDHFRRPDKSLLFEYLSLDNSLFPGTPGRIVSPGHAIESMWSQIHIFRETRETERILQAIDCVRWHLERGWDDPYGGLFFVIDSAGAEPELPHWDKKVWWPHTEALYALLLAYEHSRQSWCLDWYWKLHDYSFSRFPVPVHGEWTQRLNRTGTQKVGPVVGLPVKDPFHLARALILSLDVLSRLKDAQP